jgi:short-chain fatty acids transporter
MTRETPAASGASDRPGRRSLEDRIPEPLTLAVMLLFAVVAAAFALDFGRAATDPARLGANGILRALVAGMWAPDQLAFAFQIAGVLLFGHVLAEAPVFRRAMRRLADLPRSAASAAALTAFVASLLAGLSWGLGLVGGALLARAAVDSLRRRGVAVDAPSLAAAGYVGLGVWHGGLSGSAPLAVARAADPARPSVLAGVPLSETTFSARNAALFATFLVVLPAVAAWISARAARRPDRHGETACGGPHPAERVHEDGAVSVVSARGGRFGSAALGTLVAVALGFLVRERGVAAIDLSFVLGATFAAGLFAARSLAAYGAAFERAATSAAGVLLQFPLYFALIGVARESGVLGVVLSAFMRLVGALAGVLPLEAAAGVGTFVSACALNLLVPSGGGQWAVQGPVVAATARDLGLAPGPLVMAFAYGDQCTNLLQPFWALPLLALTRVRAGALFVRAAPLCAVVFVLTILALVV